jgi:hypothetical protein
VNPEEIDALAEAVATRVVAQLRAEPAVPPSEPTALLDARALAARLAVSPSYVYANSGKLGAVRLGNGPRARLRFNLERALEAHASAPGCTAPATPQAAKRRPRRAASSGALLPVKNGHERRVPAVPTNRRNDP